MLSRGPKRATLSVPVTLLTLALISLRLSSLNLVAGYSADIVHTFFDPDAEYLNHLVVDKNNGRVFVGGVNKLYQLSPDLDDVVKVTTGPQNDSTECSTTDHCPPDTVKKLTDDVNKALVIDYSTARLISCGSLFQGKCTVRNLHNISDVTQEVSGAVVANSATASTVAFIAPGPPDPPASQVMYVGVSYTANSPYRSEIPAVSSRSLHREKMLEIAVSGATSGTRMFVNSFSRERFPINYVHGFSSKGFSYFLTTQPKNTTTGSEFISKLVRVCHYDQDYYSYTEIPIDCTNESTKYNLAQAAYVSNAGSDLAGHLGIKPQDDVLFAVFLESNATSNTPSSRSALCIYSLKAIRKKFVSNIQHCFAGHGQRGLDFISPSHQCIPTKFQTIAEDFCGLDINTPLGGQDPIAASPVLSFNEHLTAVAATSIGDDSVVFVGTSDGYIRKIVFEHATSAVKYGDLEVDPGSPVNPDLRFDSQLTHLYVMTKQKVSKIKVHQCSVYKTCMGCTGAIDPYCGWCSLENKCSLRSDCQDAAHDPLYWISYKSRRCTTIAGVTPDQLQRTTVRTLDVDIENFPTSSGKFFCAFSAQDKTLITNATRKSYGVNCPTPRTDLLPSIPRAQHHFTAKLSVRMNSGPDLVATNFTFFDCNTYSSCTQCVSSSFPCNWCIDGHRCTYDTAENCHDDILVTGLGRIGPSYRSGPGFCPKIKATDSQEILVYSGIKKVIRVKVHIIGQFIVQSRFVCQFNIEGRVTSVNAQLLADTIYCDATKFSYPSRSPNITVPIAVVWGRSNSLDNPDNFHVVIYRCKDMADDCGTCLTVAEKYGCGWCQSSEKCEVKDQCDRGTGVWLNRNQTCPNPEIHSFEPQFGPWEGGTNVTIQGINLGKTLMDIYAGVSIAGMPCQPYPELYIKTKQIVCRVDGPGTPQGREGPVIVRIEDFRGYSNLSFGFVDPVIESISPRYGPRSGGTVIRITGRHMNAGSKIQASIDNLACSIISTEANETLCVTSASNKTGAGTLQMKFDGRTREYDGVFEYVDDPTIESVESSIGEPVKIPKGIPAGGIKISVTGENLGYVQNSQMYVYYGNKKFVSQCAMFSHSNMICNSPTIELSPEVELDAEHPLLLEYGFRMDNVARVRNLSPGFHYFLLFPDPVYEKFDGGVKYYRGDYLTINGQHLDRACQESDVIVQIGNSSCNVTSLSRHQLTCRPPLTQPLPLETEGFTNKQKLPEVIVVVGGLLSFTLGKLSYASPPGLDECGVTDYDHNFLTIRSVTPHQLQRTTARTLDLDVENLPTSSGKFLCAFSALDKTLITNATRKSYGVSCPTPRTDLLPSIPQAQHHFTAKLSVRMNSEPDLVATNFTFFDCNTYSSCTQCVSTSFPCNWCIDGHRCTHDTAENCHDDILVTGFSRTGPSYRSGPGFCPTIKATDSQEILVYSGIKKVIRVKVHIIGQFIVQSRFVCQFNIEGRVTSVNAQLLADTIYCDPTEFSYTSRSPNITVPFAVVWGGSKPLDNPDNVHVVIYRCKDMADDCGTCLTLAEKYGCGWCQSSEKCEVKDQCDRGTHGVWLNRNQTCPNPEIHSFEPQLGPWEGGTNVTIRGINLGKTLMDIYAGVLIAGMPCQPYPELYIKTKQIVCRVDGPGTPQGREGPVIVRIEDFRGYSNLSFGFVDPVIESISPRYGSRCGGTVIRITGRHMNTGSKIQASIDNLACSIISTKANETLCVTSASNKTGAGTLQMKFDGRTRKYDGVFEYVDDPTIESVESSIGGPVKFPKGIPAGGIKISVTGKNLGYVQNSQMYVYYDNKKFVSQCAIFSHNNMICNSPTIELLPEVELDARNPLFLEYGFRMDCHDVEIPKSPFRFHYFLLFPDPVYEKFDGGVKYYRGDYLTINGQHLDRAYQESDVIVQIGNSFCNVTSLSKYQLTCRPPLTQPLPLDTEGFTNKQKLPEVIVVVGGLLSFTLGKLSYASPPGLDECFDCGVTDYDHNSCTIRNVWPHQLPRTIERTLYLEIENLPTSSGKFLCAFSALDKTLITNATRESYGVNCPTPRTDLLPSIPQAQHHFTAKLSVRITGGTDLAATNFTFFDCSTYSSCTQCLSSRLPCEWCVDGHRCTHNGPENCHKDDLWINAISRIGLRLGSEQFCPVMNAISSPEILVSSGTKKSIRVKVHIIGRFIVHTRFFCRSEIEGRVITVNAELVMNSIHCDPIEFSYTSMAPKITVPFAVLWSDSRTLDNPDNIHVVVYRCRDMAANCSTCVALAEKYRCGWCQSLNTCETEHRCNRCSSLWFQTNQKCSIPNAQN